MPLKFNPKKTSNKPFAYSISIGLLSAATGFWFIINALFSFKSGNGSILSAYLCWSLVLGGGSAVVVSICLRIIQPWVNKFPIWLYSAGLFSCFLISLVGILISDELRKVRLKKQSMAQAQAQAEHKVKCERMGNLLLQGELPLNAATGCSAIYFITHADHINNEKINISDALVYFEKHVLSMYYAREMASELRQNPRIPPQVIEHLYHNPYLYSGQKLSIADHPNAPRHIINDYVWRVNGADLEEREHLFRWSSGVGLGVWKELVKNAPVELRLELVKSTHWMAPEVLFLLTHDPSKVVQQLAVEKLRMQKWCDILDSRFNQFDFVNFSENTRDVNGKTFLIYAIQKNSLETIEHLIRRGSDLRQVDSDGLTPLHWAAKVMDGYVGEQAVTELIAYGADKYVKDKLGMTPYMYAKSQKMKLILKLGS